MWDDNSIDSRAVGDTQDGAEIVGILYVIEQEKKGGVILFFAGSQNPAKISVSIGRHLGDDALVGAGQGHAVQYRAADMADDRALPAAAGRQMGKIPAGILHHEDTVNGPAGSQRFSNRVAALNPGQFKVLVFALFHCPAY